MDRLSMTCQSDVQESQPIQIQIPMGQDESGQPLAHHALAISIRGTKAASASLRLIGRG